MNTASPQFFKKSDFETAPKPDYHSYFNFQKEQSLPINKPVYSKLNKNYNVLIL